MRLRDTLTPEQERELEALDRALAGQPVEFELRDLEQLVHDVRATAPAMSPGFAARLEHEVAEGFPTPREQPARLRAPARRWTLLPALGSLAAVLVALVVVFGGGGDDSRDAVEDRNLGPSTQAAPAPGATADDARGGAAADEAARAPRPPASSAAGGRAQAAPPAPAQAQAPALDASRVQRKVERSASIAIETPSGEFERTTAAVNRTVARFGGIVASAQIGESEGSGGEATYELRIPTARLDRALAALAGLGHVTERTQGLDDITGSFTSAQERLTDARAERRGLLRALERATTQAQIDSLKAQLRGVGSRIAGLKGQLAALRRRADLATVTLTVRGTGAGAEPDAGGAWTPGDAAGDALRVLEVMASIALIALAVLVPAALIGALIAVGVRFGRRRRREAALDPT